jgi:hypothetical protein
VTARSGLYGLPVFDGGTFYSRIPGMDAVKIRDARLVLLGGARDADEGRMFLMCAGLLADPESRPVHSQKGSSASKEESE